MFDKLKSKLAGHVKDAVAETVEKSAKEGGLKTAATVVEFLTVGLIFMLSLRGGSTQKSSSAPYVTINNYYNKEQGG